MWISKKEYLGLNLTVQGLRNEFNILHEILVRIVEFHKTITIDVPDEIPEGRIVWDTVETESGSKQMTIWFAAKEEGKNGRVTENSARADHREDR